MIEVQDFSTDKYILMVHFLLLLWGTNRSQIHDVMGGKHLLILDWKWSFLLIYILSVVLWYPQNYAECFETSHLMVFYKKKKNIWAHCLSSFITENQKNHYHYHFFFTMYVFPKFLTAAKYGKKLATFMVFCNIGGLGSELNMSHASVIPFKVFPL